MAESLVMLAVKFMPVEHVLLGFLDSASGSFFCKNKVTFCCVRSECDINMKSEIDDVIELV